MAQLAALKARDRAFQAQIEQAPLAAFGWGGPLSPSVIQSLEAKSKAAFKSKVAKAMKPRKPRPSELKKAMKARKK